jgi:hypothetical protein
MTTGQFPMCPRCGASLCFRPHFPVLATEGRVAREADGVAHERLRYVAVWLCEGENCDYCRQVTPTELSHSRAFA